MADSTVLVVDDDPIVIESLTWSLEGAGFSVLTASDVAGATEVLRLHHVDAALLDMYLPDGRGLDILAKVLDIDPPPPALMMTARADIRGAVDAIRRGASDFIEKPFDLSDVTMRLERAFGNAVTRRKLASYEAKDRTRHAPIATSSAFREALTLARRVAATPASSALILGESGAGKEVIATCIHESSDRRDGPFVRVNLAAIPATMVEAELFGSVRGAYTDAKRDRAGHFASADGGTILLDEICEFKTELQSKLLRALEERRFYPVGSDRERRMNARVIAATNRDPKEMIALGLLREDLYYRLATVAIRVPPLRERADDIVPLAEHFCAIYGAEFGRPAVRLGAAACAALLAHRWPGNIRELRNVVERAVMLTDSDEITVRLLDLPTGSVALEEARSDDEPLSLAEAEKRHIIRVLDQVGGSRVRAAAILGISRSTLWERAKRLGLASR
jgi:DNA-binding NtrC family response regulator